MRFAEYLYLIVISGLNNTQKKRIQYQFYYVNLIDAGVVINNCVKLHFHKDTDCHKHFEYGVTVSVAIIWRQCTKVFRCPALKVV